MVEPKVVIVQPIADRGVELLKEAGFEVVELDNPGLDILKRESVDAAGILVRTAEIPRELIEASPALRVISRHGAGVDNIDLQAAAERGIWVTNAPESNTVSVAEHTLGMIIALAKKMRVTDIALRKGRFGIRNEIFGVELAEKNLAVIGVGRIGSRVAAGAARGLNMKITGYDPYVGPDQVPPEVELVESWERVLSQADFVTLHVPLYEETERMISCREFELMKDSAFLINCARGAVVDEPVLITALKRGEIAGAALDVFDPEPPASDNPLFTMENTILSPHSAAHSRAAIERMAVHAARGIIEVLNDQIPTWPANSPVCGG